MADAKERPSTDAARMLTEEEKEKIRSAIREKYGNKKLFTPALLFRLGSMVLIILFSIGIIINLKRRAQQTAHTPRKARVVISIDSQGYGHDGTREKASETPTTTD